MAITSICSSIDMMRATRNLLALGLVLALPAHADRLSVVSSPFRTPVVELYTSEGCSSCPPADRWISKLGDTLGDELHAVPLAFHVDYWNYLGWEDPFSRSEFTDRQRQLAAINHQRSIYTPEFLVSGEETRGTRTVVEAIQAANRDMAELKIEMTVEIVDQEKISAALEIHGDPGDALLYLAVYENNIVREIGAGENHGRTLHYDFVVREFLPLTMGGSESAGVRAAIPLDPGWNTQELGLAAMVMDRASSTTLQAVNTPLESLFIDG